jgi:RNA polymerase sigma factor (sigma-70 family)
MDDDVYKTRLSLLQRVQKKDDHRSWEEFTFFYEKYIYFICRRMKLSHHDAQEVSQKVMLKLWNKLPEMDCSNFKRFRSWLCTVTSCTAKDYIRKRVAQNNKDAKTETLFDYCEPEIDEIADQEWKKFMVAQATENISKNFSGLVMKVFNEINQGKDFKVIAEELELSLNTVYVYRQRVVKALGEEIKRLEVHLS